MYSHDHHQDQRLRIIGAIFVFFHGVISFAAAKVPFDENYVITYGYDHVQFLDQQQSQLKLSLDINSGSGFGSKEKYGSGLFEMSLKLPPGDSGGVVTTFYLHSGTDPHDELDFEFLGNREGKPITIQTNVFANGIGGREQRVILWFDPSTEYHKYQILWNPHQIAFFVDGIPIRVYKNNEAIGVGYPSQPMQVLASIWDGDSWATDGGKTKINWTHAPFNSQYRGFAIYGCPGGSAGCGSMNRNYWWNHRKFWQLDGNQERNYEDARRNHLNYDYCNDPGRYPVPPPECATNS